MTPVSALPVQTVLIANWHPTMSANGSHGHWRTHQKRHDVDRDMAWASAMQAGWRFVPGRVRLTVTLVFAQHRRRDTDNLYSRVKGVVDGLKEQRLTHIDGHALPRPTVRRGWFTDDSTDWLELRVEAEVSREWTGTKIVLESLS